MDMNYVTSQNVKEEYKIVSQVGIQVTGKNKISAGENGNGKFHGKQNVLKGDQYYQKRNRNGKLNRCGEKAKIGVKNNSLFS